MHYPLTHSTPIGKAIWCADKNSIIRISQGHDIDVEIYILVVLDYSANSMVMVEISVIFAKPVFISL